MNCDAQTIATASACLLEANSPGDNAAAVIYLYGQLNPNPPMPDLIVTTPPGHAQDFGVFTYGDIPAGIAVQFNHTTTLGGFDIESGILQSIDFPNLVSVDPSNVQGGYLFFSGSSLTTISAPLLGVVGGSVNFTSNAALVTLDLSALTSAGGVFVQSNAALTSVLIPDFLPTDGRNLLFDGNALDATSVNLVLARCVAAGVTTCTINLSGGTNSAPTGQGIIDAAALVLAGNTVTTN